MFYVNMFSFFSRSNIFISQVDIRINKPHVLFFCLPCSYDISKLRNFAPIHLLPETFQVSLKRPAMIWS